MKYDYTGLDKDILNNIEGGLNTAGGLTQRLALHSLSYPGEFFRVLDRRLQALRKANKISYDSHQKVWSIMC